MPFGVLTWVGPRNGALDGGPDFSWAREGFGVVVCIGWHWIFQCVGSAETCSNVERKLDNISVISPLIDNI